MLDRQQRESGVHCQGFRRAFRNLLLCLVVLALPFSAFADENLEAFTTYLDALDKTELVSITKAAGRYFERIAPCDAEVRDLAFLQFRVFYEECRREQNRALNRELSSEQEAWRTVNARFKDEAVLLELKRHGLSVFYSEGEPVFLELSGFLRHLFGDHVTEPIRRFLVLREGELAQGYANDAALMISYTQVGERVWNWESYLREFPQSPLNSFVVKHLDNLFYTFVEGMDNSPVFDHSDGKVSVEMQGVYRKYADEHADSSTGRAVTRYLELLKKSGFSRTKEIEAFHREIYGISQQIQASWTHRRNS